MKGDSYDFFKLFSFNNKKGQIKMIQITKSQKESLIKAFPGIHIKRTTKQKSKRHHYYCEESAKVIDFLSNLKQSLL